MICQTYVTLLCRPIIGQVAYTCLPGRAPKTGRLHVGQSILENGLVFYQTVSIEASGQKPM